MLSQISSQEPEMGPSTGSGVGLILVHGKVIHNKIPNNDTVTWQLTVDIILPCSFGERIKAKKENFGRKNNKKNLTPGSSWNVGNYTYWRD